MKVQIKKDEVSKDTDNHLKFRKKLRKMLMQRLENKINADDIDYALSKFEQFDPLLDWKFRPVCGCELEGADEVHYDLKHNKLFKRNGHLLYDECIYSGGNATTVFEGYEMWLLENMQIVFTYYVAVEDCRTGMFMTYRYPLGKKIPTEMELDTDTFLDDMAEETYLLRHPL